VRGLPEGWSSARLGDLGEWGSGGTPLRSHRKFYDAGTIPWLKIGDLNDGIVQQAEECITELGLRSSAAKLLPPGVLLVAMYGSIGKLGVTGFECATNQAIAHCLPKIDLRYLFWLLRWKHDDLIELGKGGNQSNISQTVLKELEVPVAPLAEQRRIVAAVEAHVARVDTARDRLRKLPRTLKRFREAVLAAACSGSLTGDWHESGDSRAVADGWPRRQLVTLCTDVVDCPHSTPKWTSEGEVCLRTTNFTRRGLDLADVRFVSGHTYRERVRRLEPKEGDIVYSREGGILGIACVIPPGIRACLGQRMMLMRTNRGEILPDFLCLVLNSPETISNVTDLTGGTAAPHLNVGDVKAFSIPVPTIGEQKETTRRVGVLFALADRVERRVTAARGRVERVTQAVLARAFQGELVPAEADLAQREKRDYETATQLLARIQSSRTANRRTRRLTSPRSA
jgi:type I restriction enzyme S subunit